MKTKAQKKIRVDRVSICDVEMKDFKFFKNFFENYLTEELIEGEKCEQIKSLITDKLPWEYKKNWVIVFGRDMCYNMQAKKKCLLVIRLGKLAFFIYQGKYLDMPGAEPIEFFEGAEFSKEKVEDFSQNKVAILEKSALKKEDDAETIRSWIAKFCLKHESLMNENYSDFEKLMLKKLRPELMLSSQEGFWNLFIGPRVTYVTENVKNEVEMSFSVDMSVGKTNKGKKNLVIFQKKGDPPAYLKSLKGRWKEFIGFLGMGGLFLILVMCRNFQEPDPEQITYRHIDALSITYRQADNINDFVCLNQSMLTLFAGCIFFLYVGIKVFGVFQKGKGIKSKLKKAKQA